MFPPMADLSGAMFFIRHREHGKTQAFDKPLAFVVKEIEAFANRWPVIVFCYCVEEGDIYCGMNQIHWPPGIPPVFVA